MIDRLPPAVAATLAPYLPEYAETRQAYPLWSYDRRAWGAETIWAVRLQWAPLRSFVFVEARLRRLCKNSGLRLFSYYPDQPVMTLVDHNGIHSVDVPYLYLALTCAVYTATAPAIPRSASDIRVALGGEPKTLFDEADLRAIEARMRYALLYSGRPSLLWRFVEHHQHAAGGIEANSPSGTSREALAIELCEEAGLLTSRRGGKKAVLPREMVLTLYNEALALVREVRAYSPPPERIASIRAMVEEDPQMRLGSHGDELAWAAERRPYLRDRIAGHGEAEIAAKLQGDSRWLRYPFLTPAELEAMQRGTPQQAARRLLLDRLPADISDRYLQTMLSGARRPRCPEER